MIEACGKIVDAARRVGRYAAASALPDSDVAGRADHGRPLIAHVKITTAKRTIAALRRWDEINRALFRHAGYKFDDGLQSFHAALCLQCAISF